MATQDKTPQEWDAIKFKNNLGPQIGGLLHDAVALTIAHRGENATIDTSLKATKVFLNELYKIAEEKKQSLLEDTQKDQEDNIQPF